VDGDISDGSTTLWDLKRLDLSVEAYVLRPESAPLFTEEERAIARAGCGSTNAWSDPDIDLIAAAHGIGRWKLFYNIAHRLRRGVVVSGGHLGMAATRKTRAQRVRAA